MSSAITPYRRLLRCPTPNQSSGITFATHWHRFTNIPDFYICSKCYSDYIATTPLAALCETFYNDPLPGTASFCDFNNARAKNITNATLNESGDISHLLSYIRRRSSIPMCKGSAGVSGGSNNLMKWWSTPEIESFVVCEACFEDWIGASPFTHKFYMRDSAEHDKPEVIWVCDLSVPYIRRILQTTDDWQKFVDASRRSLDLPACSSTAVKKSSKKWYRPTKPYRIQDMLVCEKCLLDNVGGLSSVVNFEEVNISPLEGDQDWICDVQTPSIRQASQAVIEENYALWHNLVNEIVSKPVCAHGAMADTDWYLLRDPDNSAEHVKEFDICAACYAGHFKATNFDHVLVANRYPPNTKRICDFNPTAGRAEKFLEQWRKVLFTGDATSFTHFVKRISLLPLCSRSTFVPNQRWYGFTQSFFFCQSCYEEIGRGSYFAHTFTSQNELFPTACCDMYTNNMRSRYITACREKSLAGFLIYCKERAGAFAAYNENIAAATQAMRIQNMRNENQLALSTVTYNSFGMQAGGWKLGDLTHMPSYVGANVTALRAQDNIRKAGRLPPATPADVAIRQRWAEME